MAQETSVVRNRVTIDGHSYEVKALGGGKFDVHDTRRVRIGGFAIVQGELTAEDAGVEGAPSVEHIGLSWAKANLAMPVKAKAVAPPPAPVAPPPPPPPPPPSAPVAEAPVAPKREPAEPKIAASRASRSGEEAHARDSFADDGGEPRHLAEEFDDMDLVESPLPVSKLICRIATHEKPDGLALVKAQNFVAWLRHQAGVKSAYIAHDPKTGKTISVTIWENRAALAAIRKAIPPRNAAQLKSLSVELLWLVA